MFRKDSNRRFVIFICNRRFVIFICLTILHNNEQAMVLDFFSSFVSKALSIHQLTRYLYEYYCDRVVCYITCYWGIVHNYDGGILCCRASSFSKVSATWLGHYWPVNTGTLSHSPKVWCFLRRRRKWVSGCLPFSRESPLPPSHTHVSSGQRRSCLWVIGRTAWVSCRPSPPTHHTSSPSTWELVFCYIVKNSVRLIMRYQYLPHQIYNIKRV